MSDKTPPIDDYERALWALGIDEETRKTYKAAGVPYEMARASDGWGRGWMRHLLDRLSSKEARDE